MYSTTLQSFATFPSSSVQRVQLLNCFMSSLFPHASMPSQPVNTWGRICELLEAWQGPCPICKSMHFAQLGMSFLPFTDSHCH